MKRLSSIRWTSTSSIGSLAAQDYRQSMGTARKWIGAELKVQGFAVEEPELAWEP